MRVTLSFGNQIVATCKGSRVNVSRRMTSVLSGSKQLLGFLLRLHSTSIVELSEPGAF